MKKSIILPGMLAIIGGIVGLASCGPSDDSIPEGAERITFWGTVDQYNAEGYKAAVNAYNAGQGLKDGVYVKFSPKSDLSNNHISFCKSSVGTVDVLGVNDRYMFNNTAQGFYTNLQDYVDDESTYTKDENGNPYFDEANYSSGNIDRFRFNTATKEAGAGEDLYALPLLSNASVLYYNQSYFEANNINIISVAEDKLEAYNAANGTSFAPRGYAEYTVEATPKSGLKSSKNLQGEDVVKVFNNLIPMSFLELNTLSKYFTRSYNAASPSLYGVLNEWWFSHGWAVGGDCVKYDEDLGQYKFTLGDKEPNYLVVNDVTVNNHAYKAGDILTYRDRNYVIDNPASDIMGRLYELPSQYEQFREFCALSQTKDVPVDADFVGYGISPSPATLNNNSKITYFTSGEVAMLVEGANAMDTIYTSLVNKTKWDAAVMYTYREFEGEDPDPTKTMKVIGKNYQDGGVFSGEVKKVNDTPIVGKLGASSINIGWAIPANSSHKEAAWKFLQFLTSKEGQSYFTGVDAGIPTDSEFALSAEFTGKENKKCANYEAISIMSEECEIGDWSYFEDGEWINVWADELNTDVRNGEITLEQFFANQQERTDSILSGYDFKLHGKE